MPSALSLPEFLTSRRHLAAAGVGLAVIVALSGAATFAPGPGAIAPVAAAEPLAQTFRIAPSPDVEADLPTALATSTSAPAAATPSASPTPDGPAITALAEQGIPIVALEAYRKSAALQAVERPSCHLAWTLVAAIGAVESGHGTHAGARLYADGQDLPHVIGPVLDGTAGNATILDTDKGVYDGDKVYDRAVGPMQFIPSTWALRGRDGNGDGKADPFNIYDAAAATGDYLCRYDTDLATDAGRKVAVFGYNHLDSYVTTVLALDAAYAGRPVTTTSPSPAAPPANPAPTTSAPKPSASPTKPGPTTPTTAPTTPKPTPTPSCPTPTPTGSPSTSPTASPTATPTGCPTSSAPATSATPSPSRTPTASPSASASDTPQSSPAATATPSAVPTA